jgi:putative SOS response-associated peptidase YedK
MPIGLAESGSFDPSLLSRPVPDTFRFARIIALFEGLLKPRRKCRETFTIVTTEPNALYGPIHNRIPVMLAQDDWRRWLGIGEDRTALPRPFSVDRINMWMVGQDVGNVKNDRVELLNADSPRAGAGERERKAARAIRTQRRL